MIRQYRTVVSMLCGAFAYALLAVAPAQAADNPFAAPQAVKLAASDMKCESGKCAVGKCKGAPAAKDGAMPMANDAEMKKMCAEKIRGGFCGAGKCAAGKCGDALKESCAKMMEGKKCGAK